MTKVRLSDLVAVSSPKDTDYLVLSNGTTTNKITWVNLKAGLGSGGSPVWGDIGGTLSNQTDLQTALNSKEGTLGNPSADDYILSSKVDGTRTWVPDNTPELVEEDTVNKVFRPINTNEVDLGESQRLWKDLWLSGDVNATAYSVGTTSTLFTDGNGIAAWSNTIGNDSVSISLHPSQNALYPRTKDVTSLGFSAQQWKDGWFAGTVYAGNIKISTTKIRLGFESGLTNQGDYTIAIGSSAGKTNQHNYSIVISSKGSAVNTTNYGDIILESNLERLKYSGLDDEWQIARPLVLDDGTNRTGLKLKRSLSNSVTTSGIEAFGPSTLQTDQGPLISAYNTDSDEFAALWLNWNTKALTGWSGTGTPSVSGITYDIDLGGSNKQFKDIYLNGRVRLKGFTTANLPVDGDAGHLTYDTTTKTLKLHDGTSWNDVGTDLPQDLDTTDSPTFTNVKVSNEVQSVAKGPGGVPLFEINMTSAELFHSGSNSYIGVNTGKASYGTGATSKQLNWASGFWYHDDVGNKSIDINEGLFKYDDDTNRGSLDLKNHTLNFNEALVKYNSLVTNWEFDKSICIHGTNNFGLKLVDTDGNVIDTEFKKTNKGLEIIAGSSINLDATEIKIPKATGNVGDYIRLGIDNRLIYQSPPESAAIQEVTTANYTTTDTWTTIPGIIMNVIEETNRGWFVFNCTATPVDKSGKVLVRLYVDDVLGREYEQSVSEAEHVIVSIPLDGKPIGTKVHVDVSHDKNNDFVLSAIKSEVYYITSTLYDQNLNTSNDVTFNAVNVGTNSVATVYKAPIDLTSVTTVSIPQATANIDRLSSIVQVWHDPAGGTDYELIDVSVVTNGTGWDISVASVLPNTASYVVITGIKV